ncbi:MAG: PAS domain S-box protein [Bacteroidota bacterium]|nr:PAS domain S-box protein [Bacteroidota bacterium]
MKETFLVNAPETITDFRAYEAAPGISVIVLPDAPLFTHVAASNDFIRTTGLCKDEVIGRGHFEVFPKSPDDPNFTGELNLRASFAHIIEHKTPHEIPVQRYDIPNSDGTFQHKYWKINNAPILGSSGEVLYIVHTAVDITEQVVASQKAEAHKGIEKAYSFFMSAPVIIGYVWGKEYIIELANESLLQVWGRTAEVIGQSLFTAIPELEAQGFRALLDQVCLTGEPFYAYEFPITFNRADKEEVRYFDFIYQPFYGDEGRQGRAAGVISVGLDVTEKVRTRQRIKNVVEQAVDPILILMGEDMVLDMANDALLNIWNVDRSAIGKPFLEILPEMREQGFFNLLQEVYRTGKHYQGYEQPAVFRGSNGQQRTVYFNFTYQPYKEADGSTTGVLVLARDVTEQMQAKKKLRESEADLRRFQFMVENAQDAVYLIREDGFITYLNQRGLDDLGYTKEEIEKLRIMDIDPVYTEALFADAFSQSQQQGGTRIETFHRRKDGGIFPVEVNLGNLRYGGQAFMFAIARDITERRRFETSLKESTVKWQQLADAMPVIVWTGDIDGRINYLNKQWYEFTGLTEEESVDFGWTTVLHPQDVASCLTAWKNAREKETLYEINLRYRTKTGAYRWVLARSVPIKNEEGLVIAWYGTSTDIHEQITLSESLEQRVNERTKELESQNNLLDSILKNSSNGISVTEMIRDKEGVVVDAITIMANDAAVNYTGLSREVYLTARATELDPAILSTPYGQMCLHTLETGEPSFSQYFLEASGRWLELTISRLDADHLIHIFTDVTPVKEVHLQLERTIEDLRRSNESLEEFAYAASHDLKEPIRKIHFFSDRLKMQLRENLNEEQKFCFERMENASRRMGSLIEDLLTYSRTTKGFGEYEAVDINQTVREVLEDLEVEVQQKGASINVQSLPIVKGKGRQLQQLFQNLITNALKYSQPDVPPVVQISSRKVAGADVKQNLSAEEGKKTYQLISVQDNGIGFPKKDADRIFEVFTRLHANTDYKGTGIGLAIAQKVVHNHDGYLWAESEPDKGATFYVLLPAE